MYAKFNLSKSKEGFDMTLYYKNRDRITTKITMAEGFPHQKAIMV